MSCDHLSQCQRCGDTVERLRAENKQLHEYKSLFEHALSCVDEAFQSTNEREAILPHFSLAGRDKFDDVVRLAKAYRVLSRAFRMCRDSEDVE